MKNIVTRLAYSFGRVFNRNEMKMFKPRVNYQQVLGDEIYFDNKHAHINGGIQKTVQYVLTKEDLKMTARGIATTLYNSALMGVAHPGLFLKIDPVLFKLQENFTPRMSFGALHGCLQSNVATPYALQFFQQLVSQQVKVLTLEECIQLYTATSQNTNFDAKSLHQFLLTHIQPQLLDKANKTKFKYRYSLMRQLVLAMGKSPKVSWEMHSAIWELVLQHFTTYRHIKGQKHLIEFYELFKELKEKGFYRSLDKQIDFFKEQLESNVDINWRYNINEQRFYSYDELKRRREEYKYVADEDAPWEQQQWLSMQKIDHVQALKNYRTELALELGEINREKEVKELEVEVEQLIKDKYKRKKENQGDLAGELSKRELSEMYGLNQDEQSSEEEVQDGEEDFMGDGVVSQYDSQDEFYSSGSE